MPGGTPRGTTYEQVHLKALAVLKGAPQCAALQRGSTAGGAAAFCSSRGGQVEMWCCWRQSAAGDALGRAAMPGKVQHCRGWCPGQMSLWGS